MRPAAAARRHWHHWHWGWMALGSSLATWVCAVLLAVLFTASIGMPGDGSHALRSTWSARLLVSVFLLFGLTLLGLRT